GVTMAGANGVAVATFAVDLVAGVLIDGVIGGQISRASRDEASENPASEAAAQSEHRPTAAGEEAMKTGRITRSQQADGAQDVSDGVAANGQDSGDQQEGKAEKSWVAKDRGEGFKEGSRLMGEVGIVALQVQASLAG